MNIRSLRIMLLLSLGAFCGCNGAPQQRAHAPLDNGSPGHASYQATSDPEPLTNPGMIADAAERVEPSVVTIDTEYRPRTLYTDDTLGSMQAPAAIPRGTGSGVILSADGVIVTNNHVVNNATKIQVTLQDGRELEGKVIGADAPSDLAVVQVNVTNLPAITLADSDKVRVGEWVIAVGDPLAVGTTVTAGIISAIRKKGTSANERVPLTAAIQTDAAINPGNSGGALADIKGRLIGINTAILSPSGGSIGIGFAIPVNEVRDIAAQLLKNGRVVRPWLGISFGPITDRARSVLNLPSDLSGVIVGSVASGSPAEQVGLQPGDVIRQANGTNITSPQDLQNLVQALKIGDAVHLSFWRQGNSITGTATLREQPSLNTSSGE